MQHQEFESPDELQHLIKCFWYTRMDFAEEESSFEVIPDGYAEITFHFGSSCSIFYNGILQPLPSPFLVGLLNQPVLFYTKRHLTVIGIRCFPWTVFDLLGLPAGKEGIRTFEHPVARLQDTLAEYVHKNQLSEAITLVKQYFLDIWLRTETDKMLLRAGGAMRNTNGTMPVSQIAEAAHTTIRTLERRFKHSSGHTIKDVAGLMRFEQVRNHLWQYPEASLAGLAYDFGYTDQAHLSREFKRYSGTTPAAFARKTKQRKKIINNDFVAFIQA